MVVFNRVEEEKHIKSLVGNEYYHWFGAKWKNNNHYCWVFKRTEKPFSYKYSGFFMVLATYIHAT